MYPSGHSFFHSEIPNSTVVSKRPFVFLQRNTKFYSCTQTTIRFFLQQNTKFRIVPKRPFVLWLRNTKFLKLFRNFNFLFDNKLKNLKLHLNCHSFFEHEIQNLKLYANGLSVLNTNSKNRNLIMYFYNGVLVILKKPAKLVANLSQNIFENRRKELISFVLVLVLLP